LAAARAAFDGALGGEPARRPGQSLTFIGANGPERRECDLYFTPIRDEGDAGSGAVRGVLCALATATKPLKPPAAAGLRILVVEDNLDSQFLICEMLSAFGHDNDGVAHAEAALEKLSTGRYNVLFSDVSLPGMSGLALARRALLDDPHLKVIFASGYGDSLLRQVEFPYISLQKPYEIEQLQKALADIGQQLQHAGA
ncbi:MAG: response regulator, partial [Massilia sp.]|nr:response regulator [Massilia sp.]